MGNDYIDRGRKSRLVSWEEQGEVRQGENWQSYACLCYRVFLAEGESQFQSEPYLRNRSYLMTRSPSHRCL